MNNRIQSNRDKYREIENQRSQITTDFSLLGMMQTAKKYNMTASTLRTHLKRWGEYNKQARKTGRSTLLKIVRQVVTVLEQKIDPNQSNEVLFGRLLSRVEIAISMLKDLY